MQEQNEINLNRAPAWRAFRAAAPQTLPVFAGYWVLGLGYGIYVQSLGLPVWLPPLMGTVVYGGSLEFVLASLLLGSFAPVSAFLMALMIQARHLFYGLTMLQRYRGYGLRSAYMIFAMSDETFSITCSAEPPEGVDKGWFMFFITLLDQIYWVASAAMGAALGSVLPFSTEGVDFVMTAMFVVIFLNQWEKENSTPAPSSALPPRWSACASSAQAVSSSPRWSASLWHCCCSAAPSRPKKARRQNEQYPVHPDHRRLRGGNHAHPLPALSGVRLPGR